MKGFESGTWNAIAAPPKTPPAIVAKLNKAINEVLKSPDVQDKFAKLTLHAAGGTPAEAAGLHQEGNAGLGRGDQRGACPGALRRRRRGLRPIAKGPLPRSNGAVGLRSRAAIAAIPTSRYSPSGEEVPRRYVMAGPMIPKERSDYSAIVDRPPLKLPGKARIVFWTIVNYEVWDIGKPMARQLLPAPTGVPLMPDVVHWGFHEYGMRVGCWRFFELFKRLGIKPTLAANARICEDYPRVAEQARDDGWEFMGHAYEQGPIHKEADQAGMINRTMDIMEKFTGKRPVGWLGPGLTQTLETPDLLAAAGVKYIGDWVYDDEPTVIHTANGPLVTLPYTIELQRHSDDADPAPRERLSAQAHDRPVRPALCREREARQIRARSPSTPTSAASRTASNISRRSTTT